MGIESGHLAERVNARIGPPRADDVTRSQRTSAAAASSAPWIDGPLSCLCQPTKSVPSYSTTMRTRRKERPGSEFKSADSVGKRSLVSLRTNGRLHEALGRTQRSRALDARKGVPDDFYCAAISGAV